MSYVGQPSSEEMEFNMMIRFFDLYFDNKTGYRDTINKIIYEAIKFRNEDDVMNVPSEHFNSIIWISNASDFMDKDILPEEMIVSDYIELRAELLENGYYRFFT